MSNFSGQKARQWRRSIASSAVRQKDSIRSLKFGLEAHDSSHELLDRTEALYNVTEGSGKQSLFAFLATVQLSGFRLFPSAGRAEAFSNVKIFKDSEFREALITVFGKRAAKASSSNLYSSLISEKRKQNAVLNKDRAAYYLAIGLGIPKLDPENPLDQAILAYAEQLELDYSDWDAIKQDISAVFTGFEQALKEHGCEYLGIGKALTSIASGLPANSTIAFDPDAPAVEDLDALFAGESVIHAMVSNAAIATRLDGDVEVKALQETITSQTASGLSWLFGSGLDYWRETPADEIALAYKAPLERIRKIKDVADAIPQVDVLFGKKGYAVYRSSFAGKLDSFIANYTNRLNEIEAILKAAGEAERIKVPDALFSPDADYFFLGMDVSAGELQEIINGLYQAIPEATRAIRALKGGSDRIAGTAEVETIDRFAGLVDRVGAYLAMLDNRLNQESEYLKLNKALSDACRIDIPAWLIDGKSDVDEEAGTAKRNMLRMPALNRLGGGVPDYRNLSLSAVARFNELRAAMRAHFAALQQWSEKAGGLDPVGQLAAREAKHLLHVTGSADERLVELRARRNLLSRVCRAARVSLTAAPTVSALVRKAGLMDKKTINLFFSNQKGDIYRSIYSRSRHSLLEVNEDVLLALDIQAFSQQILEALAANAGQSRQHMKDFFQMERSCFQLMLDGLPEGIPSSLCAPKVRLEIPVGWNILLGNETLSSEMARKLFNLYHSEMNELVLQLFTPKWFVRMRFARVGDDELLYVPKAVEWTPPAHVMSTENILSGSMREAGIACPVAAAEVVNLAHKTFDWEAGNPKVSSLLSQSPHDWVYSTGTAWDAAIGEGAFSVSKGKLGKPSKRLSGLRLIGNSAYKTELDRVLRGERQMGGMTFMVERVFSQEVTASGEGVDISINVSFTEEAPRFSIAVPLSYEKPLKNEAPAPWFDRGLAIDLGERGIAYALFDAHTGQPCLDARGQPIAGTKVITSLRALIRNVNNYRKHIQPQQKFAQKFDTRMMNMRKNVVGDVCNVINDLLQRHKAFPILENSVSNLESGSNQLKLVYESVTKLYLPTKVDAHQRLREGFWMGSSYWVHPYLERREFDAKAKARTGKLKPLSLFPGVGVPAHGTSQECACCKRNPIQAIRNGNQAKFEVKGGIVATDSGDIVLMRRRGQAPEVMKENRRQNRRPAMDIPVVDCVVKKEELLRLIKENIRRPQDDRRSRDTTQSRYHCVYKDCGHTDHADRNAAFNIGRRFFGMVSRAEALAA